MKKIRFLKDKNFVGIYSEKIDGNMALNGKNKNLALKNRAKIAQILKISSQQIYEGGQVHKTKIAIITKKDLKKNFYPQTDGLITNLFNVYLAVKTADCFPIVFYDSQKKVLANLHTGNFGASQKIFLEALLMMVMKFKTNPANVYVWLGPGARDCCYYHRHLYQEKLPEWEGYIKIKKGQKYLDIPNFIIDKLISYGVKKQHIFDSKLCTICQGNFFSYFLDKKKKKNQQMLTLVGLKK